MQERLNLLGPQNIYEIRYMSIVALGGGQISSRAEIKKYLCNLTFSLYGGFLIKVKE